MHITTENVFATIRSVIFTVYSYVICSLFWFNRVDFSVWRYAVIVSEFNVAKPVVVGFN